MKTKNLSQTSWFTKQWQLNMTSKLFVTGGFRKPSARKNLIENNYEREESPYLQFHKPYDSTWVITTDFAV